MLAFWRRLIFLSVTLGAACAASADQDAALRDKIASCAACHGPAGAAPIQPDYPILAGQHFYYTYVQLRDLKSGLRESAIMNPIAAGLEKDDMKAIAQYFAEQGWPENASAHKVDQKTIAAGRQASAAGQCVQCHLGGYEGASGVPRLAGQNYEYLRKTLLAYKNRERMNAPDKASLMEAYSDDELDALAKFLAAQ